MTETVHLIKTHIKLKLILMKKILFLLLAATFALCNCTKQDLDEIRAKQAELDTRLSALEEWQRAINGQIASLQNLFSALG